LTAALTLEDVEDLARSGPQDRFLVPMKDLLLELPALTLRPEGVERVRHGNRILPGHVHEVLDGTPAATRSEGAVIRLLGEDRSLLALARLSGEGEGLSPFLVLAD
jgi:tRNA U55 pseudouridine synthase TruB